MSDSHFFNVLTLALPLLHSFLSLANGDPSSREPVTLLQITVLGPLLLAVSVVIVGSKLTFSF